MFAFAGGAMFPINNDDAGLSREDSTRLDHIVDRFEQAWQQGERPTLDAYLPAAGAGRQALLIKLVHVDLERRLKAGETVRVEEYCDRYPELVGDRGAVL